jgi:hypothetical protein
MAFPRIEVRREGDNTSVYSVLSFDMKATSNSLRVSPNILNCAKALVPVPVKINSVRLLNKTYACNNCSSGDLLSWCTCGSTFLKKRHKLLEPKVARREIF